MKSRLALSLLLIAPPVFLHAQQVDVQEHTLKNGLQVLLAEDHTVPSACVHIFFKSGGKNEQHGLTGLAHLFEHMMFNGSAKFPPKTFDHVIEAAGGYSNAQTSSDFTDYFEEFNSDKLEQILEMEADRMRALKLDAENLEQERGIVKEERRLSVDNNPVAKLYEDLYAAAFFAHMYGQPVIGWMSDIDRITLADAKEFFRINYAPNNAVLILTGDFNSSRAIELVEKYFADIPAHDPPRPVSDGEPEQQGERRIELHKVAQSPAVLIGYKSVAATSPDFPPLDLLGVILAHGESSRLHRRLVYEKQIASDVEFESDGRPHPALSTITCQLNPGKSPRSAEKEIDLVIGQVQAKGVTDAELQKAKNVAQMEFVSRLATNQERGYALGYYEVVYGGYKAAFDALKIYDGVTKDDIQRVARKYLQSRRRTVATLVPEQNPAAREAKE